MACNSRISDSIIIDSPYCRGVCTLGSVLSQQKFVFMMASVTVHVISSVRPVLQLSSIQKVKENKILKAVGVRAS